MTSARYRSTVSSAWSSAPIKTRRSKDRSD
jgi:hypothetical protein